MRVNVLEAGARGDGKTDDTAAIQGAIDAVYEAGGGTVFFPFRPQGYRLAKPAEEAVNGFPCRSQLYIPCEPSDPVRWRNICLEGEMPVRQLYDYQVRGPEGHGAWPQTESTMAINNTVLFSDWEAPENRDEPAARPWSLLSVLGGSKLPFGVENVTLRNLEFRVHMNPDKMYPTATAANLAQASRLIVEHCHFGLDRNVGSFSEGTSLQPNPCHCAGLIASGDQNDHQSFRSVGVQGFRYGFVLGEHVVADYLYVHNCEEGIVFHDCSHLSHLGHVVAQNNRIIVSALREDTFELRASHRIYFIIDSIDYEPGNETLPPTHCNLEWAVYDPDNRMKARIAYHCGCPCGRQPFPVCGAEASRIHYFLDPAPEGEPG